ncbi:MAG: M48 family metallopeptidase [Alphaproteobacteria bacterium]
MASSTIGLSTHIWNNNLRCILLLVFYPVLILAVFWAMCFAIGASLFREGATNIYRAYGTSTQELMENGGAPPAMDWSYSISFANNIAYEYWPLILTGVVIWFLVSWFFHTSMIRSLSRSHPVSRQDEPELYNLLENLCIGQGIAMPHLEIIETHARNAFASGVHKGSYAVTVTRGLMNSLSKDELEAVLGHELTHIQNRDVRLLIVTVIFTGLFGFLAQIVWSNLRYSMFYSSGRRGNKGGVVIAMLAIAAVLWLGYMASLVMRFALSRRREYMADAGAIEMTKNPEAMMSALMRIAGRDRIPEVTDDIAMMCIENHKSFLGIFATHPPIEKRIRAISEVTGTPIPDQASLPPIERESSFSERTRDKSKRENPWLIRQRRD